MSNEQTQSMQDGKEMEKVHRRQLEHALKNCKTFEDWRHYMLAVQNEYVTQLAQIRPNLDRSILPGLLQTGDPTKVYKTVYQDSLRNIERVGYLLAMSTLTIAESDDLVRQAVVRPATEADVKGHIRNVLGRMESMWREADQKYQAELEASKKRREAGESGEGLEATMRSVDELITDLFQNVFGVTVTQVDIGDLDLGLEKVTKSPKRH